MPYKFKFTRKAQRKRSRERYLQKKLCQFKERSTPNVMSQVIHNTLTPQMLTTPASTSIKQIQSDTSEMQNLALLQQTLKKEPPLDILEDFASPNATDPKGKEMHERQMKSPIKRQTTAAYLKLTSKKLNSNNTEPPEPFIKLEEGVYFTSVLDERPQEHSGLQDNSLVETILPDEGLTNKEMLTQGNSIPQPIKIKLEKPERLDFYHVVPKALPPPQERSASEHYNNSHTHQQVKNESLYDAEIMPQLPQFVQNIQDRRMKPLKRHDE